MPELSLGRHGHVVAADHVHARLFDDELVVLDLNAGEYFALDEIGARMWHQLLDGRTPMEIAEALLPEYDADVEQLVHDCVALADELLERGLLRKRDG